VHLVKALARARDLCTAAWTWLASPPADVHLSPDLLAELRRELALDDLGRALERGARRAPQPVELTGVERRDATPPARGL
jgi:hypothetical protein